MSFREELPADCPPAEAEEIASAREVFRVVRALPPNDRDFDSQRSEKPDRDFPGVSECLARGISVFAKRSDCDRVLKLSHMRNRKICRVRLDAGAGKIQQTFQPSHHTWWPLASFDILGHCDGEQTA